jgi:hypothetical protein
VNNFLVLALVFTLGFTILAGSADNAFAQAIRNNPGFTTNTLLPNDDGSTGSVAIGFVVDFFNVMTGNLFVNNNGNITFDFALPTFTPFDLTSTGQQIIAPFFADVDTSNTGSPVTYGQDTVNGRPAFGVNWINVDCFASGNSQPLGLNDFQLVIIERSDTGPGNFDFEFNYDSIMWETGQASGGNINCLGGTSARVGYSDGTGNPGTFFELAGSAIPGAFLDNGPAATSLIQNSIPQNTIPLGRYLFEVREGQVSIPTPVVSGEILDVDSSALLLAGLQANLAWMVPIGVSSVIGVAYLARNRWQ